MAGRHGRFAPPPGLERQTMVVGGVERTFWTALPAARPAPLLLVFHGLGLSGPHMARWTGMAERGPQAGFATVFPDAWQEMWDDHGQGRTDGIDDAAFVVALIDRLVTGGITSASPPVLAGVSNGAFFVERLARHGLVAASGLALVVGTAREASRRTAPRPVMPTAVLCVAGTADPMVPYGGGRATGPLARMARRRTGRLLAEPGRREVVAAETVAGDWAARNACSAVPSVEPVAMPPGDPAVERLSWTAPGCPPVVLYRIAGGGHGWPGGPQFLPAFLIGRIARHLDATGLVLGFARERTAV